jgi:DNA-binding transcriptional ArsR family regulator
MPARGLVTAELARLLSVLAHPQRIRIVEELRERELDVNSLQELLTVPHSRVSQQLSILRSMRVVLERRQGRHVYYRLAQPELAAWLLAGLKFVEGPFANVDQIRDALDEARRLWGTSEEPPANDDHHP